MKIFRAVEKGIEIPENLDDLVIPDEPAKLEDSGESKAEEEEDQVSDHVCD